MISDQRSPAFRQVKAWPHFGECLDSVLILILCKQGSCPRYVHISDVLFIHQREAQINGAYYSLRVAPSFLAEFDPKVPQTRAWNFCNTVHLCARSAQFIHIVHSLFANDIVGEVL